MKERRIINEFSLANYRGPQRKTVEHLPPPIARAVSLAKPPCERFEPAFDPSLSDVVRLSGNRLVFSKGKIGYDIVSSCPLKFRLLTFDSHGILEYSGESAIFLPSGFTRKFSSGSLILDNSTALLKVEVDVFGGLGRVSISRTTDFMLWDGVFNELSFARFYLLCNSSSPLVTTSTAEFVLSTDPDLDRRAAYSRFKDEFYSNPTSGFSN